MTPSNKRTAYKLTMLIGVEVLREAQCQDVLEASVYDEHDDGGKSRLDCTVLSHSSVRSSAPVLGVPVEMYISRALLALETSVSTSWSSGKYPSLSCISFTKYTWSLVVLPLPCAQVRALCLVVLLCLCEGCG